MESSFVKHISCDSCGSSDANAVYSDGNTYCFSCEKHNTGTSKTNMSASPSPSSYKKKNNSFIQGGGFHPITARKLTEQTCRKFGYKVSDNRQIAPYYDAEGNLVAQKIRRPNKNFSVIGDISKACLFGQHLWGSGGKILVVTEGEIDCMSVSQLQNLTWPVVSLPNGVSAAVRALTKELEWLSTFERVVLMFDGDTPGREAASKAAKALPPGLAYIASLPDDTDPNSLLVLGKGQLIIQAMWNASQYKPEAVLFLNDIKDRVFQKLEVGIPWCFPVLTNLTYGRRVTELYGIGAGTGIGKTDILTQQIAYDIIELDKKVGVIYLEQPSHETVLRIASKIDGKRYYVPETDREGLEETVDRLKDNLIMYNNRVSATWESVKSFIRYLALSENIVLFYLDHLTALVDLNNERVSLELLMREMAGLALELNIIIHYVSHLATPEGKSHEEGGRVTIRHYKGSRAIGYWTHFMFALERDQQSGEDIQITTLRILKDRFTGASTGKTIALKYSHDTGKLSEYDGDECPF